MLSPSLTPLPRYVSIPLLVALCWQTLRVGFRGLRSSHLLCMVYEVAKELRSDYAHVPIIGIGGICNANDALEFLMAGASAIEVGTMNFVNPRVGIEILEGIEAFLKGEGIGDVKEIIGVAL